MESNNLPAFVNAVKSVLPALGGSNLTFNKQMNAICTPLWTCASGHSYGSCYWVGSRVIVKANIGLAWWGALYLNGLECYCFDGTSPKLIGLRTFSCTSFSTALMHNMTRQMIVGHLTSQCKMLGVTSPDQQNIEITADSFLSSAENTANVNNLSRLLIAK